MYYPDLDVHDVDDHPQFFGTEASPIDMSIPDEGIFRRLTPPGYFIEEGLDESIWMDDKSYFRVKTAPARPLTEIEEFRKSKAFFLMERTVFSSTHLIQTYNNRYDIDSMEGQMACKTFLNLIEKLHEVRTIRHILFSIQISSHHFAPKKRL